MIPKAELLALAEESGLLPTTIEKDHALGWFLFGIAQHPTLGRWLFKGGTCLKKCYFDTYRFSEDLDFTLPEELGLEAIGDGLKSVANGVSHTAGLQVPEDDIAVEESVNKHGQTTFLAKVTFRGPLTQPRHSRQRVKFDLTHHEWLGTSPNNRVVFHPYSDAPDPAPLVRCYALEEILAEKTRALVQRAGRARDVYDVVNISRNFRERIDVESARELAERKFAFKGLPRPSPEGILAAVQLDLLASDWEQALRHQIRVLPPIDEFLDALAVALRWLFVPEDPVEADVPLPAKEGETRVPAPSFGMHARPKGSSSVGSVPAVAFGSKMDRIRFAARNRLLALFRYHGEHRLVEPYSLRLRAGGNLLLYAYELQRGGTASESIKAFKVDELGDVSITPQSFRPRFLVEL